MLPGVVLSFITVFLWSLESVFSRYAVTVWEVQPFAYTSLSLFIGALALLVVSGPGNLGISTIKQPHTWAFSVFDILTLMFFVLSVQFITATESNFLNRVSIPITVLATWLFLARRPHRWDLPGLLVVLAGLGLVAAGVDEDVRWQAFGLCFLVGISQTARTLIAETHPTSNMAENIKDRCRTSGYVLYVASLMFMLVLMALAGLRQAQPDAAASGFWQHVPQLADFFHTPTLLLSAFFGVVLVSSMTYFYLYASRVAKSELFMFILVFLPLVTFAVEYGVSLAGLLDVSAIRTAMLLPGGLIVLGALLMVYSRHKRHQTGEAEDGENLEELLAFADKNMFAAKSSDR